MSLRDETEMDMIREISVLAVENFRSQLKLERMAQVVREKLSQSNSLSDAKIFESAGFNLGYRKGLQFALDVIEAEEK